MKTNLLWLIVILLVLLIGVVWLIVRKEREKRNMREETRLVGKRIRGTNFVAKGTLQEHVKKSKS